MRLDHVILATDDLDRTCLRLGHLGLGWVPGGRHDGIGTLNRIVPLGVGYLELLTVVDPSEARTSPFGSWALRALIAGEALMGWAVAVDDVEEVAGRLGAPVEELARAGLVARLTGVSQAAANPALPFFIARSAGTADPGRTPSEHDVVVEGFDRLELGIDEPALQAWLDVPCELGHTELHFAPERSGLLGVCIRAAGVTLRV